MNFKYNEWGTFRQDEEIQNGFLFQQKTQKKNKSTQQMNFLFIFHGRFLYNYLQPTFVFGGLNIIESLLKTCRLLHLQGSYRKINKYKY